MVAEVQPLRCMDGYPASIIQHRVILTINGERVVNMQHAAKLVRAAAFALAVQTCGDCRAAVGVCSCTQIAISVAHIWILRGRGRPQRDVQLLYTVVEP